VAGIEVGGSFDEAPDRAFRPLAGFIDGASRSRRQIAMTAPVTQQKAGWEHPEKMAMTAPVVQQTAGRPGWRPGPPASTSAIPRSSMDTTPAAPAELQASGSWFTYELQRRLPPDAITANAVCPGSSLPLPRRAPRVRCAG